jgi:dephospho-CoA kinase
MSTERRAATRGPFRLGLVGRTGSGKSTVARALADDGAVVIDADALGHEVTDGDPEVRAALGAEYGPDVYAAGRLDRRRVAARVFADPAARARLDALVHPRILERIRSRIATLEAEGFDGVVVIDAALLLDWGLERELDAVALVTAPDARRIERLARARGWSADEARQRLAVQRDDVAFRASADVTLDNSNDPETLAAAARALMQRRLQRRMDPC